MSSLKGHLLIAPAHMTDPNFSRAVVLMIQHETEGAVGVILNRPTPQSIAAIWPHVSDEPCTSDAFLYAGGPVAGPLVALHGDHDEADLAITQGIYCTLSTPRVVQLVKDNAAALKLFAGYAGWGGAQLDGELQTGSWLTIEADRELVLETEADALWQKAFRRASSIDTLPSPWDSEDPPSPSLN